MEKLCTKGSVQKEDTLFKCNLYLRTSRGYLSQVFWMTHTDTSPGIDVKEGRTKELSIFLKRFI